VAWENVQAPKTKGGLGVKDLELQNKCLLMKFIDKIFSAKDVGWKAWLLSEASPLDSSVSATHSYLWRIIDDEMNTYRSLTYVILGNGAATSFWFDHWLPGGPLSSTHSALFSHTTMPNISVQKVFLDEFDLRLRPRLTNAASNELCNLLSCLQGMTLSEADDTRLMKTTSKPYTTRDAYAALDTSGDALDPNGHRIWSTHLPNKVKIFAWLFFRKRLSTKDNLHLKHVVEDTVCQRCITTRNTSHSDALFIC
jgi:hypothetical protein